MSDKFTCAPPGGVSIAVVPDDGLPTSPVRAEQEGELLFGGAERAVEIGRMEVDAGEFCPTSPISDFNGVTVGVRAHLPADAGA
jgi:hypothetical protein